MRFLNLFPILERKRMVVEIIGMSGMKAVKGKNERSMVFVQTPFFLFFDDVFRR